MDNMAAQTSQYPQHHPLPSLPQQAQTSEHHQYQVAPRQQQQQQQQQQQPPQRPQPKGNPRRFSFRSDKSRKNSVPKVDLHETHAEKDSNRIHGKADPTMAMNEAEPAVEAAMTSSSLSPLRAIQHKDRYGNLIADPDKSNPTRNRWERPLDTIRSFEAAIEGDYARRSIYRSDTEPARNLNRRSSYQPSNQPRFPQDSYYGSRAQSFRGEGSQYGMTGPASARNSYYDNGGYYTHTNHQGNHGNYGKQPARERPLRMSSDPNNRNSREQNVYPLPHKDRSYETVTSAGASGNSDPAGYQTDPTSSDNSSIHKSSPAKRAEQVNDYGIGFSQTQPFKPPALTVNLGLPGNKMPIRPTASYQNPAPTVPRKEVSLLKRAPSTQPAAEKRKSWFARRFSKNS